MNTQTTLFNSPLKLFLLGSIGLLILFPLGTDLFSLIRMKEDEQALHQLQLKKENILAGQFKASLQQTKINQPIFLNQSEAGFTLAKLCETSQLLLTQMQLGKRATKMTQNTFEISLNLMGDYWNFLTFFNQLTELAWHVDWQTVHIILHNSKTMKKTKNQSDEKITVLYPLEIKLKLAIAHQYVPIKKISQSSKKLTHATSPFVMRHHVGKLIEGGKTIDLIDIDV